MPIEQRRQDSAGVHLVPHLLSVSKSMRQLMQFALAELDISVGQDSFFLTFEGQEARAVIDVAAALSVRPSTVSKMVDILEKKGWAERQRDDQDLRKVLIRLTPKGMETRRKVLGVWDDLESRLLAAPKEDRIDLPVLQRLDKTLTKRLSRLR